MTRLILSAIVLGAFTVYGAAHATPVAHYTIQRDMTVKSLNFAQ